MATEFKIPQAALPREVEWPPGSGRLATYQPHEFALARAIVVQAAKGEISSGLAAKQLEMIHDGLMLGGRFLEGDQVRNEEDDPDSGDGASTSPSLDERVRPRNYGLDDDVKEDPF